MKICLLGDSDIEILIWNLIANVETINKVDKIAQIRDSFEGDAKTTPVEVKLVINGVEVDISNVLGKVIKDIGILTDDRIKEYLEKQPKYQEFSKFCESVEKFHTGLKEWKAHFGME